MQVKSVISRGVEFEMPKFLLIIFMMLLVAPDKMLAQGRSVPVLMEQMAEAKLLLSRSVLEKAVSIVENNPDIGAWSGHNSLKRLMDDAGFYRSILAIDRFGQLKFDSYNPLPFFKENLSDRDYVAQGRGLSPGQTELFKPVIGRQSGLQFLPMVKKVPTISDTDIDLVVLTIDPNGLLPELVICTYCGMFIMMGDQVLVADQKFSEVNNAIAERLDLRGNYGSVFV